MGAQKPGSTNDETTVLTITMPEPVFEECNNQEYKYSIVSGSGPGELTSKQMNRDCLKVPNFTVRSKIPDHIELGKDDNEFLPYSKNTGPLYSEEDRQAWLKDTIKKVVMSKWDQFDTDCDGSLDISEIWNLMESICANKEVMVSEDPELA